jgi:hypothetical protein
MDHGAFRRRVAERGVYRRAGPRRCRREPDPRCRETRGFSIANFSYRLDAEGRIRSYSITIASADRAAAGRLALALESAEYIQEFRIAPTGD